MSRLFSFFSLDEQIDGPRCSGCGSELGRVYNAFGQVFLMLTAKLADQAGFAEIRVWVPTANWRARPRSVAYIVNPDTSRSTLLCLGYALRHGGRQERESAAPQGRCGQRTHEARAG